MKAFRNIVFMLFSELTKFSVRIPILLAWDLKSLDLAH